ncbi:MAG: polyribonucleotide nucleotidyltransferase [Candidatus Omnitrophica bacterium]|nr:polyribonucleotide nucleotidyltransferase [Candidatus Omnitrophota bacterium]
MQRIQFKIGKEDVIIETGKLAKQADGAVTIQCGGTVVLSTVCVEGEPKEGQDFFPLMVDYREKTYAAGKIPGGFFKREGRPSEREILTCRLIDRPIRPLFPKDYMNDVQVAVNVLCIDENNSPDVLAIIATSCALQISSVPFLKPIAAVRVGYLDGAFIVNPSYKELETSKLDLVVAASEENVVMVEAGASVLSEEEMLKAILFGHAEIKKIISHTKNFGGEYAKPKQAVTERVISDDVRTKVDAKLRGKVAGFHALPLKEERKEAYKKVYDDILDQFDQESEDFNESDVKYYTECVEQEEIRDLITSQKKRPDGRGFDEIRPITCEVSVLPRTHGSAVFTRGQTQSLGTVTLGTAADQQIIDALEGEYKKGFMLHYNFPSFSVGEVRPNRGPGRREIGHGALAERALKSVMPDQDKFPYTVRIVSEILESNGSSSMATVCSGTLALMDAGVPISAPVAGIAMGLVTKGDKWEILTDIAGIEDHLGDMDFKVAGTKEGITALQLDIKITGLTEAILKTALEKARIARLKILDAITNTIASARPEISSFAPQITTIKINQSKIGALIGPGGKTIRGIIEATGAEINVDDEGVVQVAATDKESSAAAIRMIKDLTEDVEIGKIYEVKVDKIMNFGAFCQINSNTSGLVHVSEIANGFVKKVEDHLKVGDVVQAKVLKVDENGKISLSIKAAQEELQKQQ